MVQHVQGSMAAARWARARAEGGGRGGRKRLADSEPHRRAARRSVGPAGAAKGGGCIFLQKVKSTQVKSSQVKSSQVPPHLQDHLQEICYKVCMIFP